MSPLLNISLGTDAGLSDGYQKYKLSLYIIGAISLACLFINSINFHIQSKYPTAALNIKQGFLNSAVKGLHPSELDYGNLVDVNTLVRVNKVNSAHSSDSMSDTNYWFTTLINLTVPPDRIWSIYTPYSSDNANFFANGFQLGDVVNSTSSGIFERGRPSLISIPNGILKSGSNEIQIQFTNASEIEYSNSDDLLLGPLSELSPYYQFVSFNTSSLPVFMFILAGSLALCFVLIWKTKWSDRSYAATSSTCLLWMAIMVFSYASFNQGSHQILIDRIASSLILLLAGSIVCQIISELSLQHESGITLPLRHVGVALILGIALVNIINIFVVSAAPQFTILFLLLLIAVILIYYSQVLSIYIFALLFSLSVLVFDSLDLLAPGSSEIGTHLSSLIYLSPFFLLSVLLLLLRDFIGSRLNLEYVNKNLEFIIKERTEQFERENLARKKIEHDKAIADERNRIMMEMHDGMGSKLVGLISQIDSSENVDIREVKSELRETLNDLRMVVDSINPVDNSLIAVLANYRIRLEKSLKGSDLELIWDVGDIPHFENMDIHSSLNILRILQEACTNALKYSTGTHITITAKTSDHGDILLSIHDNGDGFDCDNKAVGKGLQNMSTRANQLGGDLFVDSGEHGVSINLRLLQR